MALQHGHWTAERHSQPSMLHVEGEVTSTADPVDGGYAVTTGARLTQDPSPEPAHLKLELVLDLERRATSAPHEEQFSGRPSYHEAPAREVSQAYQYVYICHQGEILAVIPVKDVP